MAVGFDGGERNMNMRLRRGLLPVSCNAFTAARMRGQTRGGRDVTQKGALLPAECHASATRECF